MSADGIHTGRIVIKSKNSQFKVTIPYHAHVITGGLRVTDERITRFHMREEKRSSEMTRNFSVKNTFPVAVAVHNVSLGSQAATNNFKLTKVIIIFVMKTCSLCYRSPKHQSIFHQRALVVL